jgi:hypothetical protein
VADDIYAFEPETLHAQALIPELIRCSAKNVQGRASSLGAAVCFSRLGGKIDQAEVFVGMQLWSLLRWRWPRLFCAILAYVFWAADEQHGFDGVAAPCMWRSCWDRGLSVDHATIWR